MRVDAEGLAQNLQEAGADAQGVGRRTQPHDQAEFIATASHELRTPLAAVYGAAQTLSRHDFALDEAGRARFIQLIVDESDRLATIVNQILLANQLEVGRVDLETEPFDGPGPPCRRRDPVLTPDARAGYVRLRPSRRVRAPPHATSRTGRCAWPSR